MSKIYLIYFIISGLVLANFASASVLINEIAWMGTETSAQDEWIELYNISASTVNLEGWILKSVDNSPEIHLSGTILANGFYLLERTDDNTVPDIPADQIYVGALTNSGEHLQLYDAQNNLQDSVDCSDGWLAGNNETKQTMELSGSYPNNWQSSQNPGGTPKARNNQSEEPASEVSTFTEPLSTTTEEVAEPITYPTGVLITEILPSPLGPDEQEEWIEIYNENEQATDISLWQISDTVGTTHTYTFPENTVIEGHGFLILHRPESKITLNNQGDTLNLVHPDNNIIDTVTYEKASRNLSYSRTISGWKWSSVLSPGAMNIVPTPETELVEDISPDISTPTSPTIEELAAIGEQIPKGSSPTRILLIALAIAIACAILIFGLKKRLTRSSKSDQDNLPLPFK